MSEVYQIKITLSGVKPPIWRRLLIASDTTLTKLHQIIQIAMGWTDSHLHLFIIGGERYTAPMPGDSSHLIELGAKSSQRVKLNKLITTEGEKFLYEYDFGDGWEHEVLVEKVLPAEQKLPVCITGKRACPPEDVGGIWGYETFLQAIQDPRHPEYKMLTQWIGGSFDAEAFDLEGVNQALQQLR